MDVYWNVGLKDLDSCVVPSAASNGEFRVIEFRGYRIVMCIYMSYACISSYATQTETS